MGNFIYADNSATTKLDSDAYDAMQTYLENEYGNASSAYSFSRIPKKALKDSRIKIMDYTGAAYPDEIYFTSGGTESDNWAVKGAAFALRKKGNHIITSQIEHHAVLNSCKFLETLGYEVTYVPVDSMGLVSIENLEKAIRNNTILVSIMLANNEIGTIQNIRDLAQLVHSKGILFHTDAVQALGHIPVKIDTLGIDLLSASAHKFNGPKGVGFLYVKRNTPLMPYLNGGMQEFDLRAGTENIAGIVGMAVALHNNISDIDKNQNHLRGLSNTVLKELEQAGVDFRLNGHSEKRLPGHLSLSLKSQDGEAIMHRLDYKGICISTGAACNSKVTEVSHVIKAIKVPSDYTEGTIRISFGKENTKEDAVRIANELTKIVLRK